MAGRLKDVATNTDGKQLGVFSNVVFCLTGSVLSESSVSKCSTCAVKKLFEINHENTKVRKHETRYRNALSCLRQDFSDRINKIYMILS